MNSFLPLFAQGAVVPAVAGWAEAAIVVAAIIGILLIVLALFKIEVPSWFKMICWILLAAVIGIAAIHLLVGMTYSGTVYPSIR